MAVPKRMQYKEKINLHFDFTPLFQCVTTKLIKDFFGPFTDMNT